MGIKKASKEKLPKTIAIIPDGNRRWAKTNGTSVFSAYSRGAKRFIEFSEWCAEYGIKNIIVWGLSTENVGRPKNELDSLFKVYLNIITDRKIISRLREMKTRLLVVGEKRLLPKYILNDLNKIKNSVHGRIERRIFWLLGYGGKDDLVHAAKAIAAKVAKGEIGTVDEQTFKRHMLSHNVPDIDLIIRTADEFRLSGFMPWQSAYSELYFVKKYWPDFSKNDLEKAIAAYSRRDRTFGV